MAVGMSLHSQRKDRHAETGLPIWGAQNCQRTQGKRCDEGMGVKFRPKNGQERRRVRAGRGGRVCWRGETSVERGDTKESACISAYQAEAQQGADRQAGSLQVGEGGCLCLPGH